MKRIIGLTLVLCLMIVPAQAQQTKIPFDQTAAWSYVRDLAADAMVGRESGQPGAFRAEEYIASRFRQWGLEPAGDNGSYFQAFTIEHNNVAPGVVLEIISENERRSFYCGEDWRVQSFSGSGHFMAEVVFAGYGIHAPEEGYDDYAGIDAEGKLLLISTGFPGRLVAELEEEGGLDNRVRAAQQSGASGVLIFQQTSSADRSSRMRLTKDVYDPDFVILSGEQQVARFVFEDLDIDLSYLFSDISRTSTPKSFPTGVKAFVSVNAEFDPARSTRNVLARITGSDRVLREETVIIGAHMDHVGIGPLGHVMNGANDNASGTAVVMEIARVMKLNRARPRRTVVFALWAGEEQQLLGSIHYLLHPTNPVEKTITYINLDMVGQGSGNVPFTCVNYAPHIWEILEEKLPGEIMEYVRPGRGEPGPSDHTGFLAMGIPSYVIMTEGPHFKTHRRHDDIELIKPEMLKRTGDFVYAAVEILASQPSDLILPGRRENYYLRYQNLVDYHLPLLNEFIDENKETENPYIDLQLALVEETPGPSTSESRSESRMAMVQSLLDAGEKLNEYESVTAFSSASALRGSIRQGRTTVMPGLGGVTLFRDDPRWFKVAAGLGAAFVVVRGGDLFPEGSTLRSEGRDILEAINDNGLLLLVRDATSDQAKMLLETSEKPLVLLQKEIPDEEVLGLIRETKSALGLVLAGGQAPADYFNKLDRLVTTLGMEYVMIVNEQSLLESTGKEQMLGVISEMLKAKYENLDNYIDFLVTNLFSGTFLRVLEASK